MFDVTKKSARENLGGSEIVPPRGFLDSEYEERLDKVQESIRNKQLDAIVLTSEHDILYFSGFYSQFWQSPTRPWFMVLPAEGKPIAVIPSIGFDGMDKTWLDDIRVWESPNPKDEGVSLLARTILELPRKFSRIGFSLGAENYVRMPLNDYARLGELLNGFEIADVTNELQRLQSVKSSCEIAKLRYISKVTSEGFAYLPSYLSAGETERETCKKFMIDLLNRGADSVPFMIAGSGYWGYQNIIMGPTDRIMNAEDVLVIDTGAVYGGYYCDFDRNYAFGHADQWTLDAYDLVYEATNFGLEAAVPGATCSDVFWAMQNVLDLGGALREGQSQNCVGRYGHGIGVRLTEWPSISAKDHTLLEVGMVLAIEPSISYGEGRLMVQEENVVITEQGAELLSHRASEKMIVI